MSKLLPPFHKVKYSNLECDLANDRIAVLEMENEKLERWVDDLQAGGWVNCVYCGKRYGARDEQLKVHETMREALEEHVESCPKHPLAKYKAELMKRDHIMNTIWATLAARKREAALYNEAEWTGLALALAIVKDLLDDEPS